MGSFVFLLEILSFLLVFNIFSDFEVPHDLFLELKEENKQAWASDPSVGLTVEPTDNPKVCTCSSFEQPSGCDLPRQEDSC